MMRLLLAAVLLQATTAAAASAATCTSDLDCSLNGVCSAGSCSCDKPWRGVGCQVMGYAAQTPASAKDLFPINRSHNTWNGPIVGPVDGQYHLFDPLYGNYTGIKSLFRVEWIMHGVASKIEGPYDWTSKPTLPGGINPAQLTFNDSAGKTVYSLWNGGIRTAPSPDGPWTQLPKHSRNPCGGNPAPAHRDGVFYCTSQHTKQIYSAAALGGPWSTLSDINITAANGSLVSYASSFPNVEDPFLWIDKRNHFHIINHRYVKTDLPPKVGCYSSTISSHVFSPDGKTWHVLPDAPEPYTHTVHYDDGTAFSFATLERPNIHFDPSGQMTHINFAADLTTGDAGCGMKKKGACCAECKFYHHCGTTLIKLDV